MHLLSISPVEILSIDAWVYPLTVDNYGEGIAGRLQLDNSTGWGFAIQGNIYGNAGKLNFFGNDNWAGPSNGTIATNAWTHVAITRSGTLLTYYINGSPSGSYTFAGNFNNDLALAIGDMYPTWTGSYWKFNGLIDEVEIFDRALTSEEISAIHQAGSSGKCKVFVTGPCCCYAITCTNLDSGMVVVDHPVVLCFDRETNTGFFNGLCNASGDMSLFFDAMNKEALAYSEDNPYGYLKFHGDWLHVVTGIGYCAGSKWDMRGRKVADENCPENMWPYNPDPGL